MLTFEEARSSLLRTVAPLADEVVPVAECLGRVLRVPLLAPGPMPPFAYSAMDGFALAVADLPATEPLRLPIAGESRAGRPSSRLEVGHASRISTGAEIPTGADAVVPREQAEEQEGHVVFTQRAERGQHIRRAGEDLEAGAVAIDQGTRLGPAHLGLALSLDVTELGVGRRPRVTVLCTGDELRTAGSAKVRGKIPDSISLPLRALAAFAGAEVRIAPHVGDTQEATERALAAALADTDLLVTVGGVSVGDHDWVRPALLAQGVALDFWKVAIKPGKPIAFGRHRDGAPLVLGLPGNPASALVTFALFGAPLLRALQADAKPLPRMLKLPLGKRFRHKPGRLEFVRVTLDDEAGDLRAVPLDNQASGALTSLAWAEALALVPAAVAELEAGAVVDVLRFDQI